MLNRIDFTSKQTMMFCCDDPKCNCHAQSGIHSRQYKEWADAIREKLKELGIDPSDVAIGFNPGAEDFNPSFIEVDEEFIRESILFFDETLPLYKGMLKAKPRGPRTIPGEPLYEEVSQWVWDYEQRIYEKTGKRFDDDGKKEIIDLFIDRLIETQLSKTERFLLGSMPCR